MNNTKPTANTTPTQRIIQAIEECDRFIAKESSRRADLRPTDMQQHLDFCISHRKKLQALLS